jgi:hypothetical protein
MYFANVFLRPLPKEPQYADVPTLAGPLPVNDEDMEISDENEPPPTSTLKSKISVRLLNPPYIKHSHFSL